MEKEKINYLDPKYREIIATLKEQRLKRVLFVCLGNICRSPAGEGVLRALVAENGKEAEWEIDSAGTGGYHAGDLPDRRMRVHALQRGLTLDHICRKVRPSDFEDFDLIIGMDDNNVRDLRRIAPSIEAARKIVPMAAFIDPGMRYDYVPDPYYEGAEGFELVLDLLQNGCANMFALLSHDN